MKLYFSPGACSKISWICLEWIGQPYEVQQVSIHGEKSPELLAVNPLGAVPALEDQGWALTQNMAILNYLVDLHPETLLPGDQSPKARAELNRWLAFLNADVHPLFKPLFGATAYLEDEAIIEKTKAHARATIQQRLALVDQHLQDRDWIVNDAPTPADAYIFVIHTWTQFLNIDLSALKNVNAHFARMSDNPAVQRVLAREAEFMGR